MACNLLIFMMVRAYLFAKNSVGKQLFALINADPTVFQHLSVWMRKIKKQKIDSEIHK